MSALAALHPVLSSVTARIRARSAVERAAYVQQVDRLVARPRGADRMGCANVAHAFAALPASDKLRVVAHRAPNLAIVSAYNDMLSAHQPYEGYPALIRDEARRRGATAQVAGGVPAMCDGVTQGQPGMELSLFSRDTIAMGTAVALSHDVFDAALLLGVCDKIVPGLLIGALHFGHLPCVFVPAGPMSSGLSNTEKSRVRERAAQGLASREELLAAESAAYHGPGTCTFYGTANSNQMLLEAMGLHVPGAAFVHPHDGLREALTREAVRMVLSRARPGPEFLPIGRLVDERSIVNAMVALLATGGSTNHVIHWVAVARAAGLTVDWDDFDALSAVVPLLARVYPNGTADVNAFQAAGGPGFVLRELMRAGLMHADAGALSPRGLAGQVMRPVRRGDAGAGRAQTVAARPAHASAGPDASSASADSTGPTDPIESCLVWEDLPAESADADVLRTATQSFSPTGGLRVLQGPLGRAVIKVSAVPDDRHLVQAPARVFDSQEALHAAFAAGELDRDVVVVVRFQGPRANGMPELHKLTPPLTVLQRRGHRVALVTDGRMSGASGTVPAAIHVCPEALDGGPLARLRDGDVIRLDARAGRLEVLVDDRDWAARVPVSRTPGQADASAHGLGRDLFAGMRRHVRSAEDGAVTWL
jgi:phosphogluconate dehydratase